MEKTSELLKTKIEIIKNLLDEFEKNSLKYIQTKDSSPIPDGNKIYFKGRVMLSDLGNLVNNLNYISIDREYQ